MTIITAKMRLKILCVILALICCSSCEKENGTPLTGKWKWIKTCNLNLYIYCLDNQNSEIRKYVEFTNKDEIIFSTGNSITQNQKFKLSGEYFERLNENINAIKIEDHFFKSYIIKHDTLILSDTCFACYYSVYVKLSD
jgi:hypothetical protein